MTLDPWRNMVNRDVPSWNHLSNQALKSSKPSVYLLSHRRIKDPLPIRCQKVRERGRIAVLLTEFVVCAVLVQCMKDIDGETDVIEVMILASSKNA